MSPRARPFVFDARPSSFNFPSAGASQQERNSPDFAFAFMALRWYKFLGVDSLERPGASGTSCHGIKALREGAAWKKNCAKTHC